MEFTQVMWKFIRQSLAMSRLANPELKPGPKRANSKLQQLPERANSELQQLHKRASSTRQPGPKRASSTQQPGPRRATTQLKCSFVRRGGGSAARRLDIR